MSEIEGRWVFNVHGFQIPVEIDGHLNRLVTQDRLELVHLATALEKVVRERMAEIMALPVLFAGVAFLEGIDEPLYLASIQLVTPAVVEDPSRLSRMLAQEILKRCRHPHLPVLAVLGILEIDEPRPEIYVLPLEAHDLAAPRARVNDSVDERIEHVRAEQLEPFEQLLDLVGR